MEGGRYYLEEEEEERVRRCVREEGGGGAGRGGRAGERERWGRVRRGDGRRPRMGPPGLRRRSPLTPPPYLE